jgi:hypothetical protein
VACDCGGRNVDVFLYHCTDSSTCGDGWSCVNGACVMGEFGGGGAAGGGIADGGGATGGSAAGGGAALGGGGTAGGSPSGGGGATGGGHTGGGTGGGGPFDGGAACDVDTGLPCAAGYTCQWTGNVNDFNAGLCTPGCDPLAQVCGMNLKCALNPTDTLTCLLNGNNSEGQVCQSELPDICRAGYSCALDIGPNYFCRHFCNWTDAGCPDGQFCMNTLSIPPGVDLVLCEPNPCRLFLQDCGSTAFSCRPFLGGGDQCTENGPQDAGGPCTKDSDCGTGYGCGYVTSRGALCQPYCNLDGGAPACPASEQCTPVFDWTGFPAEGGTAGMCLN